METNAATEKQQLSEAEHLLRGKWAGHGMQLLFEAGDDGGRVSMRAINDQPEVIMNYTLHYLDNQLRIKIQSNAGERNYIINQLTDQLLELSDAKNNLLSLQRAD